MPIRETVRLEPARPVRPLTPDEFWKCVLHIYACDWGDGAWRIMVCRGEWEKFKKDFMAHNRHATVVLLRTRFVAPEDEVPDTCPNCTMVTSSVTTAGVMIDGGACGTCQRKCEVCGETLPYTDEWFNYTCPDCQNPM